MSKPRIAVALLGSALAFAYALLGLVMAGWISAVPGNSPAHVRLNFIFWASAASVTFVLSAYLLFRLLRLGKTAEREPRPPRP